jgi:hypothetical protein
MNNFKSPTYGGELTEFCIIEHRQNIVAIGIRYLPEVGMHYVITSPIVTHVNEFETIRTWDKHYKLINLVKVDTEVAFYQAYFDRIVNRGFWVTELVVAPELKTVN